MTSRDEFISVGSATAAPGQVANGELRVGRLSSGSDLTMPVCIANGRAPGPTLWLNGAVHGDEVNAFMVMRRLIASLDTETLQGAVVCTPLSNPASVNWRSKINNLDWLDLDQQFPGRADGTYSQRVAHILFEAVRRYATHLISFHTVGTAYAAEPYTVFKAHAGMSPDFGRRTEAMALSFGTQLNCRVDLATATGEIAGGVNGGIDAACAAEGIIAFMAEIGSGGDFQEGPITTGLSGTRAVMAHLGMIGAQQDTESRTGRKIVTKRTFAYADAAGMLIDCAPAGALVKAGQPLGRIVNFFEDRDVVRAARDSIVIMSRRDPVVHEGDRLAFLALEWQDIP
ncbi:M14 family metallopeptidase [Oryzicola mucosus]|nr:succinylglutamate desuccinylase/aspartoacylase family protein [Oryzicola mucosus]